jgi:tryptophan-rich sensory protein
VAETPYRRQSPSLAASLLALAGFGAAVGLAALVGGLAVGDAGGEYAAVDRPTWAPPGWLFGPVWTVLYVLIALAGWLVWRRTGLGRALVPYTVQLVLNAAWTPIFFGAGAYGLAAIEIIALWCAIAATVIAFWRIHSGAAVLMLPYWAWVTFATVLNLMIWSMNR